MRRVPVTAHAIALCTVLAVLTLAPMRGIANTGGEAVWRTTIDSVFRVYRATWEFQFACTGWYLAPVPGATPVSVYITAGHCSGLLVVDGYENTPVIARLRSNDAGADLTIAERQDPRPRRTFLPLADSAPVPGERALVIGYGAGVLTELTVTALSTCQQSFICFNSRTYIKGGLSGSPIVSLATGRVLGILVDSPEQQSVNEPYIVIATPAQVIRAVSTFVLPTLRLPTSPVFLQS